MNGVSFKAEPLSGSLSDSSSLNDSDWRRRLSASRRLSRSALRIDLALDALDRAGVPVVAYDPRKSPPHILVDPVAAAALFTSEAREVAVHEPVHVHAVSAFGCEIRWLELREAA